MKDNFIPDFMEVFTEDQNKFEQKGKTSWVEAKEYSIKYRILVLDFNFKTKWLTPKLVSHYSYSGRLIDIDTSTCNLYFKPSSWVLLEEGVAKANELKKKDSFTKRYLHHSIEKIKEGLWDGEMYSFSFGEPCYLPIKFEKDYCLIPV